MPAGPNGAILLVGAAVASAAAPLKGRAYFGADKHQVHFTVSASGRSLSDFGGEFSNLPCAMNAMPAPPKSGKIAHGRFTLTAHHGLLTETVSGSFRAHGRASGTFSAAIIGQTVQWRRLRPEFAGPFVGRS